MKRRCPFVIVLVLVLVLDRPSRGAVIDVEPQRGHAVAQINWTDETNRTHQLSEFSGYPVIILPIYTRCRSACVQNVARLKKALSDSSADPRQFRVLVFSFDATDTPAILAKYREREAVPLKWSIGAATQPNIDALLDSLAFPVGKAGSEFTHPNMVLFLDGNLRIAHWLNGTAYSTRNVDAALRIASGDSSWLAQHSEWLYALLLFSGSLLCVALCHSLLQFKARRQITIAQPATR